MYVYIHSIVLNLDWTIEILVGIDTELWYLFVSTAKDLSGVLQHLNVRLSGSELLHAFKERPGHGYIVEYDVSKCLNQIDAVFE